MLFYFSTAHLENVMLNRLMCTLFSVTAKLAKNSLFTIRFPTTIMASQYYQSLIIVDSDHKAFPFPTVGPCVGNFGIRKPLQIPTKKNHHII